MIRILKTVLRFFILALILAALVAGGAMLIKRKQRKLNEAPRFDLGPVPVRVLAARKGDFAQRREYLAVVEPVRRASIAARLTATIEKVLCDEGDPVGLRQPLLLLDDREIRDDLAVVAAQIEQARADRDANAATITSLRKSLAYWQREAARDKKLADKGDIPAAAAEATADKANAFQGQLDAAVARSDAIGHQIESLGKRSEQIGTQLSYCKVLSPFKGLVTSRLVDPGDLAAPGKILLVVEDRSELKLSFDVPQGDLAGVREGLAVGFHAGAEERAATLSHLFPALDRARMLRAEVNLTGAQAAGLDCGAYVPLHVVVSSLEDVTLISSACVIEGPGGKPHLFVLRGEKLEDRPIEVLGTSGDDVAVRGVAPGEQVVASTFLGWARLASGMRVEALR